MTITTGYIKEVIFRSSLPNKPLLIGILSRLVPEGGLQEYSDIAIETALFIRQVFHLPLRQAEGFMNSLARVIKADIAIPDFSSISKRSIALPRHDLTKEMEPVSLGIVDSTGLKVYRKD
jgi:hypothetical protein